MPRDLTKRRMACRNCGELFVRTQETKRFCSARCRFQFHHSGGVPLQRIDELISRRLDQRLPALIEALVASALKKHKEEVNALSRLQG